MVKRDEGHHYILKKGKIHQDIKIVNMYAPNIEAPKHIKQKLKELKSEINSNVIIVGYLNTSLSTLDRLFTQNL